MDRNRAEIREGMQPSYEVAEGDALVPIRIVVERRVVRWISDADPDQRNAQQDQPTNEPASPPLESMGVRPNDATIQHGPCPRIRLAQRRPFACGGSLALLWRSPSRAREVDANENF
ncbi:hypothetical protein [Methylorubrum salsuginis]|uniref:hypothetical protein n=1 Tax=Methylorubrum salsuginis TaxID=414703 RepID=UPI001041DC7D|nr:hypothetical protein [Methylorubrum salsuginis]